MKISITLILLSCLSLPLFAQTAGNQDKKSSDQNSTYLNENIKNSDPLGLVAGIDYKSNYIWRGTNIYNQKEGVLMPWLSMVSENATYSFTCMGEYAAESIGDGGRQFDDYRNYHSADFGINASTSVDGETHFGLGLWYFWRYLSQKKLNHDDSFGSLSFFAQLGSLPLSPRLSYTHDLYVDKNAINGDNFYSDFYIELSIGQDFFLTTASVFNFSLSSGYYNNLTRDRKGISNIKASFQLLSNFDRFTVYGGLNFSVTPYGGFSKVFDNQGNKIGDDVLKWWTEFGVRCSL